MHQSTEDTSTGAVGEDFLYWLKSRGCAAAGAGPRDGAPRFGASRLRAPHRTPRQLADSAAQLAPPL